MFNSTDGNVTTPPQHNGEQRRRIAQQIRAIMKADGSWADYLASGKTYSDLRQAPLEDLRIIRAMYGMG